MTDTNDPATEAKRRIAALWDPPSPSPGTRGRPAKVSRAEVVDAAIKLADAGGLDAASMRSTARALGVGAMTLYTHVGSQPELVDAMVDRAYADFEFAPEDAPWREAVEQHARSLWKLHRAHPWLADVNPHRLPLGPHVLDVEEAGYRTIIDTGLTARQVAELIGIIQNIVVGHARSVAAEEAESRAGGIDYNSYWKSTTDFWENYFDTTRYSSMTRLWSCGAFDTDPGPFDVPLAGLLQTLDLLVEQANAQGSTPVPTFDECMARYDENVARQVEEFKQA
ncbi:TetR family transcriptional regulator [Gordonia araii NBRC 100433]|uniref:TetR family transcriptional regulator n=1 Tax=Gordonia araii NBRC 100433 TaxID=1073574 RepID=G7GXD5_9ACTN|nr:TetR/AcrR family transcriptional regulator [Gordonia araii]NNG95954.1 TetR/AcrR family transcriptional regulator [Gordonia araii NBRC 100433]GAB08260.1 TetR family transcriptional regulator [Gordonia araii NBRC 100433]